MADPPKITDADLLDYVEGRLPAAERAAMALHLAENPGLAIQCAHLREQLAGLRLLRPALTADGLPLGWMELVARLGRR
jgi:anti-sigma factor RsiW